MQESFLKRKMKLSFINNATNLHLFPGKFYFRFQMGQKKINLNLNYSNYSRLLNASSSLLNYFSSINFKVFFFSSLDLASYFVFFPFFYRYFSQIEKYIPDEKYYKIQYPFSRDCLKSTQNEETVVLFQCELFMNEA